MRDTARACAAAAAAAFTCCAFAADAEYAEPEMEKPSVAFNAGADLRVRQELMDNVPGLPGGGILQRAEEGPYRNQMRYRVRAWGDVTGTEK